MECEVWIIKFSSTGVGERGGNRFRPWRDGKHSKKTGERNGKGPGVIGVYQLQGEGVKKLEKKEIGRRRVV